MAEKDFTNGLFKKGALMGIDQLGDPLNLLLVKTQAEKQGQTVDDLQTKQGFICHRIPFIKVSEDLILL